MYQSCPVYVKIFVQLFRATTASNHILPFRVIDETSVQSVGKDFCPNCLQHFLSNIDRRSRNDGSRESFSVFHDPLLRQWVLPWSALLGRVEWEGDKNRFSSTSKRPVNILSAVIRSARRRFCKECTGNRLARQTSWQRSTKSVQVTPTDWPIRPEKR